MQYSEDAIPVDPMTLGLGFVTHPHREEVSQRMEKRIPEESSTCVPPRTAFSHKSASEVTTPDTHAREMARLLRTATPSRARAGGAAARARSSTLNVCCTPASPFRLQQSSAAASKPSSAPAARTPLPAVNLAPMRFSMNKGVPAATTPRGRHFRNSDKKLFDEANEPLDQRRGAGVPASLTYAPDHTNLYQEHWRDTLSPNTKHKEHALKQSMMSTMKEQEEAIAKMSLDEVRSELHKLSFAPKSFRRGFCKMYLLNRSSLPLCVAGASTAGRHVP